MGLIIIRSTVMALLLLAAPVAAEAQPAKVWRIGWLWDGVAGQPPESIVVAFRHGLREAGMIEGQNIAIEYRTGPSGSVEQRRRALRELTGDLIRLKVDVIVANPAEAAAQAREVTQTVPIVFAGVSDPIRLGFAVSLTRPGASMTGLSYLGLELNTKRLELLKEVAPAATRIGVLVSPNHPTRERQVQDIESAARALGVQLQIVDTTQDLAQLPSALEAAVAAFARERVGGVIALQGPGFFRERQRIADLLLRHRLPGIFELREFVEAGCLMAYAPSLPDIYRRAAIYVDKILRGAKPADLPIEQPTKFELVINAKAAKALNLTIPASLLLRADKVIE